MDGGKLKVDIGRARAIELPQEETERAVADHDAAVADHARRAVRRDARSDDGAAQVEPRAGGVCAGCGGGQPGAGDEGRRCSARWAWKWPFAARITGYRIDYSSMTESPITRGRHVLQHVE